jgi:hypothetical protein
VNDRYGASACGAAIRPGGPKLAVSRRSGDEIHPWLLNGDLRPDPDIATDIEHQGVLPEACGANAPVSKLSSRFLYEVVEFGYTTSQSCNIASGVIRRGRAFG